MHWKTSKATVMTSAKAIQVHSDKVTIELKQEDGEWIVKKVEMYEASDSESKSKSSEKKVKVTKKKPSRPTTGLKR